MLSGCAGLEALVGRGGTVAPLMKAEGWRDALGTPSPPFAVLEIAFDRETAERAWRDHTPDGLPERDGAPEEPGLYGDLDEVDVDEAGTVTIERDDAAGRRPATSPGFPTGPLPAD